MTNQYPYASQERPEHRACRAPYVAGRDVYPPKPEHVVKGGTAHYAITPKVVK